MLLRCQGRVENVSPVADTSMHLVQTEVSHPRVSAMARWSRQMPWNVAIRLTSRGKWIPNGERQLCEQRGETISLVMETACRGNRRKEDTSTKAKRAGRKGSERKRGKDIK